MSPTRKRALALVGALVTLAATVIPVTAANAAPAPAGTQVTKRVASPARAEAMRIKAVNTALRQVGDAYVGGGTGPRAFDCSGLTMFAWRAAGVRLEHYSVDQWRQTKHIHASAARPGDLVFYLSNGAHHVAMYIGHGKIVHASDYGVGVIISTMRGTPWTRAHFTGVGRVV